MSNLLETEDTRQFNVHGPSISKSKFFLIMQVSRSFACRQASPNVEARCCGLSFPGHSLLFSGREASGQREVQLSRLGAGWGGGGSVAPGCPSTGWGSGTSSLKGDVPTGWSPATSGHSVGVRITKWGLFHLGLSWSCRLLVFQVFRCTQSLNQNG